MRPQIYFVKGDITDMAVDAIVNAANTDLILGAGVAGALRSRGGNLKAHYVIHAASMHLGGRTRANALALTTRNSLLRAEEKAIRSIAFPAIGTGIAGFPMEECANIMIKEVLNHIKSRTSLEKTYFVLFDDAALKIFEETYKKLTARPERDRVT